MNKTNTSSVNDKTSKKDVVVANDNKSSNSKTNVSEPKKEEAKTTEESGNKAKLPQGSTRQYLESTVVNAVMQGMAELSKARPDNPLEFLGKYLIEKSKEVEK